MKNFIKAMNRDGEGKYLKRKFPHLSNTEIKEETFVGLQTYKPFQDDILIKLLNGIVKQLGELSDLLLKTWVIEKMKTKIQLLMNF